MLSMVKKRLCHTLRGCVDWNNDEVNTCIDNQSHPTWVCGLKQRDWQEKMWGMVTPYVGVWIETLFICTSRPRAGSHPTWVCGLKLKNVEYGKEKAMSHPTWVCGLKQWWGEHVYRQPVTPYVGVWIETTWLARKDVGYGHTLRGCVDWNSRTCL